MTLAAYVCHNKNMETTKTKRITIRVEKELDKAIKKEADDKKWSKAGFIRNLLKKHFIKR